VPRQGSNSAMSAMIPASVRSPHERETKAPRKSGRRRPRSGVPRLWPDLRCAEAVALRADVQALTEKHPGAPRAAVVDAAIRLMRWREAEADLATARQQRKDGKGKRPSAGDVRSLQKRAGLECETWLKFEARLRELAARHAPTPVRPSALEVLQSLPTIKGGS